MKRLLLTLLSLAMALGMAPLIIFQAQADGYANPVVKNILASTAATGQGTGIVILPEPYTVPPNQPVPAPRSTVGLINAVCDVTLDFVSCGFGPAAINIVCDTNGDGVPELMIPLTDITQVNPLLVQAKIPSLGPGLPGTPFPLSCCGGMVNVVLSKTVTDGDDNIFGPFTDTVTVAIDIGQRAPVVISASPSDVDCAIGQNIVIPGSCFLLADNKPNVTSVFAVELGNPANVIQAQNFVIVNSNVIDAHFDFGAANAGKSFLIFASGPNGTSRNLTQLPTGTPTPCPLGNEQGIQVTVTCRGAATGVPGPGDTPPSTPAPDQCQVQRTANGTFSLVISGGSYPAGAKVVVGGITPKKLKFKGLDATTGMYKSIVARKNPCNGLPGDVVVTNAAGGIVTAFFCDKTCAP